MIGLLSHYPERDASNLVLAALRRSVSRSMAMRITSASLGAQAVVVAISPNDRLAEELVVWLSGGRRKLILLGHIPPALCSHLNLSASAWPTSADWALSPPAETGKAGVSAAEVHYHSLATAFGAQAWVRPLERFDFTNEWNNLGYGAIRADGSIWALSDALIAPTNAALASIVLDDEILASYCALFEDETSSVLWINREVGTIDSFEWRLVERFISEWRWAEGMPCRPVLSEIPFGFDTAVTMRLDCDEDITSANFLWDSYREMDVPLSLAIHTSHLTSKHRVFLQVFHKSGGAVLSHTATHAPNWGGSYEAALVEGYESRRLIAETIGEEVAYAVSPFHQSPHYALAALCDVGYSGCIGGIIRNDPEFLLARGGELADFPHGFIGHSQQCMLHGDCLLKEGDPLAVYKAAFDRALEIKSLFGFLDHPFSERYQYGWANEETRASMHRELVRHIRTSASRPLFLNEIQALDFLRARAALEVTVTSGGFVLSGSDNVELFNFGVEYCGELFAFKDGAILS